MLDNIGHTPMLDNILKHFLMLLNVWMLSRNAIINVLLTSIDQLLNWKRQQKKEVNVVYWSVMFFITRQHGILIYHHEYLFAISHRIHLELCSGSFWSIYPTDCKDENIELGLKTRNMLTFTACTITDPSRMTMGNLIAHPEATTMTASGAATADESN